VRRALGLGGCNLVIISVWVYVDVVQMPPMLKMMRKGRKRGAEIVCRQKVMQSHSQP
jgi:hypothetical protein